MATCQSLHVFTADDTPCKPNKENDTSSDLTIKLYKRRWAMLVLFFICCLGNALQYIQYCIIADTVVKYYGVSYIAVDWSAMVFLLLYIPFIFPGIYILDKLGLRLTVIMGMIGTCAGAWIKVASVSPDKFWVLILGQSIVGMSEVFLIGLPPRLAAVWFGPDEVSSTCAIGIAGIQAGTALGFLIPPLFVDGAKTHTAMGEGLYTMSVVVATFNSILLLLVIAVFQAKPPNPPSAAQHKVLQNKKMSFMQSLVILFLNRDFVLLLLAYGIYSGVMLAVSMLFNQIFLESHPDAAVDAGRLGLCEIAAGIGSSVLWGVLLDKFKQFRKALTSGYVAILLGFVVFAFTIDKSLPIVYPAIIVMGFLMEAMLAIGYEVAAELTYPVPEGTSGGILAGCGNLLAIVFTYLYSYLLDKMNSNLSNLVMFILLVLGFILVLCMRWELRRQNLQIQTNVAH